MTFEPTTDMQLVRQIMTHRDVYPGISDDGCPAANEFRPMEGSLICYLLVILKGKAVGLFVFVPHNTVTLEVHICLLRTCWGPRAIDAARGAAKWIWQHTRCERVVANIPEFNTHARRLAEAAGLTVMGINKRSYLKRGRLWDQFMFGISKPEVV